MLLRNGKETNNTATATATPTVNYYTAKELLELCKMKCWDDYFNYGFRDMTHNFDIKSLSTKLNKQIYNVLVPTINNKKDYSNEINQFIKYKYPTSAYKQQKGAYITAYGTVIDYPTGNIVIITKN